MPSKKPASDPLPPTPRVAAVPIEGTAPAVPMVCYRGSVLRGDGGWDVIDITISPDASREEVMRAISNWHLLRTESLAALRAANRRWGDQAIQANPALILTFGKHAGKALAELITADPEYLTWLSQEARDEEVRVSALYLIHLASAAQRLAAISMVSAAVEEARAAGVDIEAEPPAEPGDVPF